jgi:hypothetical protein
LQKQIENNGEFKRLEELDEQSRQEVTNRIKQCLDLYFKQLGNSTKELTI